MREGLKKLIETRPGTQEKLEEARQRIKQEVIRRMVGDAKRIIEDARAFLMAIQEECTHPQVNVVSKSDTGNYDPSSDRYWDEYACPDCEKRWSVNK